MPNVLPGVATRGLMKSMLVGQLVGVHQRHGLRLEDPRPGELATVQEHLAEPRIVRHRRHQPAAAGQEIRLRQVLGRHGHQFAARRLLIEGRQAVGFVRRCPERRVHHTQRLEDPLPQHLVERLAGQHLDQVALDVHRNAVVPRAARLLAQRNGTELPHHVLERRVAVQDVGLLVEGVDLGAREEPVGQSTGVADQFADGHLVIGIDDHRLPLRPVAGGHLQPFEFGNEFADGVVEREGALVVERHQRNAGDGLGHGVDAEDRVRGHRRILVPALLAGACEMHELAVPRHERHRADEFALVDHRLHERADLVEPRLAQADVGRCRAGQAGRRRILRVRGDAGLEQEKDDKSRRTVSNPGVVHQCSS